MEDFIVTINDIRKTGHCTAGARRWFNANGLDFREFLKNGLPASVLEAKGDAMAAEVISKIRSRRNGG